MITRIFEVNGRRTTVNGLRSHPDGSLLSVVYCLLTFIYQQIRCTASRPVMQGIGTARSHKDFQPPLGIFLPSKEKEIIILENQIIILGKIPVSNV